MHRPQCFDYLDALTTFGFLIREVYFKTAKYSNSVDTDFFQTRKNLLILEEDTGIIEQSSLQFLGAILEEGLMTGLPQNEAKSGGNLFEALYSDADRLKEFIHAMSGIQNGKFYGIFSSL